MFSIGGLVGVHLLHHFGPIVKLTGNTRRLQEMFTEYMGFTVPAFEAKLQLAKQVWMEIHHSSNSQLCLGYTWALKTTK